MSLEPKANITPLEQEAKAQQVIAHLKLLHPEMKWGLFPLCDYDQYAELAAPDMLICFGAEKENLDEGLVDAYSDIYGVACEPSAWGLSIEAAQILHSYNRVSVAKYPNADGPRSLQTRKPRP